MLYLREMFYCFYVAYKLQTWLTRRMELLLSLLRTVNSQCKENMCNRGREGKGLGLRSFSVVHTTFTSEFHITRHIYRMEYAIISSIKQVISFKPKHKSIIRGCTYKFSSGDCVSLHNIIIVTK